MALFVVYQLEEVSCERLTQILNAYGRHYGLNYARLGQILKASPEIFVVGVNPTVYSCSTDQPDQLDGRTRRRLMEAIEKIHPPMGDDGNSLKL